MGSLSKRISRTCELEAFSQEIIRRGTSLSASESPTMIMFRVLARTPGEGQERCRSAAGLPNILFSRRTAAG